MIYPNSLSGGLTTNNIEVVEEERKLVSGARAAKLSISAKNCRAESAWNRPMSRSVCHASILLQRCALLNQNSHALALPTIVFHSTIVSYPAILSYPTVLSSKARLTESYVVESWISITLENFKFLRKSRRAHTGRFERSSVRAFNTHLRHPKSLPSGLLQVPATLLRHFS